LLGALPVAAWGLAERPAEKNPDAAGFLLGLELFDF